MTSRIPPPPPKPVKLDVLRPGDSISYPSGGITIHMDVLDVDERQLPVVEVSASHFEGEERGFTLVQRINEAGMRGVLLGTIKSVDGTMVADGMLARGIPFTSFAVEMVNGSDDPDEHGMYVSAFPIAEGEIVVNRNQEV